ncbi:MAG: DUF5615 family PIN-like protein [Phycisphaerales bacterium]|nr:DUF5615 family PIN-like protein [Phycisphaerales bacterium]
MLIKLDENLPYKLKEILEQRGHTVHTLTDEHLVGEPDDRVWAGAQSDGALLITQDLDFSDIRKFEPGAHHGIVLLRLREPGRSAMIERIGSVAQSFDITSWAGCLVVITDYKVRVRRPARPNSCA